MGQQISATDAAARFNKSAAFEFAQNLFQEAMGDRLGGSQLGNAYRLVPPSAGQLEHRAKRVLTFLGDVHYLYYGNPIGIL